MAKENGPFFKITAVNKSFWNHYFFDPKMVFLIAIWQPWPDPGSPPHPHCCSRCPRCPRPRTRTHAPPTLARVGSNRISTMIAAYQNQYDKFFIRSSPVFVHHTLTQGCNFFYIGLKLNNIFVQKILCITKNFGMIFFTLNVVKYFIKELLCYIAA